MSKISLVIIVIFIPEMHRKKTTAMVKVSIIEKANRKKQRKREGKRGKIREKERGEEETGRMNNE